MEAFKELLKNYWSQILAVLMFIGSFILQCFKKKPITKIYDSSIYRNISILIKEAEEKFGPGNGSEKLEYVLNRYCELYNIEKTIWNIGSIKQVIEFILSTPHKKE